MKEETKTVLIIGGTIVGTIISFIVAALAVVAIFNTSQEDLHAAWREGAMYGSQTQVVPYYYHYPVPYRKLSQGEQT